MSEPNDLVGCDCDEFPECTHALYFYMGAKHAMNDTPDGGCEKQGASMDELRAQLRKILESPVHNWCVDGKSIVHTSDGAPLIRDHVASPQSLALIADALNFIVRRLALQELAAQPVPAEGAQDRKLEQLRAELHGFNLGLERAAKLVAPRVGEIIAADIRALEYPKEELAVLDKPATSDPEAASWKCKAQRTADPPQDCGWPGCGCDPYADKVIAALFEGNPGMSAMPSRPPTDLLKEMEGLRDELLGSGGKSCYFCRYRSNMQMCPEHMAKHEVAGKLDAILTRANKKP
jgi:hypothetical protein